MPRRVDVPYDQAMWLGLTQYDASVQPRPRATRSTARSLPCSRTRPATVPPVQCGPLAIYASAHDHASLLVRVVAVVMCGPPHLATVW